MRTIGNCKSIMMKKKWLERFNPLWVYQEGVLNMKRQNPMPTVAYQGQTYKLKSRKTQIPDFESLDRMSVLIWLNRNTTAKGYFKTPNPLIGMGGAIDLKY
jgi:hypothetical protein